MGKIKVYTCHIYSEESNIHSRYIQGLGEGVHQQLGESEKASFIRTTLKERNYVGYR